MTACAFQIASKFTPRGWAKAKYFRHPKVSRPAKRAVRIADAENSGGILSECREFLQSNGYGHLQLYGPSRRYFGPILRSSLLDAPFIDLLDRFSAVDYNQPRKRGQNWEHKRCLMICDNPRDGGVRKTQFMGAGASHFPSLLGRGRLSSRMSTFPTRRARRTAREI